jgi:hypothetical protein
MKTLLVYLLTVSPAHARGVLEGAECPEGQKPPCLRIVTGSSGDIQTLITSFFDFLFRFAVIIAPAVLVIAAIMMVTSAGNEERIKQARKAIYYTIIGFAIIILARAIAFTINFVLTV